MSQVKNHRIVVPRRGGPEVLDWIEEDLCEPRPGEVRVKVQTIGVSAFDIMLRKSWFPGFTKLPYTPGEDIVGVVDKLGNGVSELEMGQSVAGWTFGDAGAYTEFICRPANQLVIVPHGLDKSLAVALVMNYLTAHIALFKAALAKKGERVLVNGAGGGLGSALLQLGKRAGFEMYGTDTSSKLKIISELGAIPIDYRRGDIKDQLHKYSDDGVDVVIDLIGGPKQLWRSYRMLRKGGRLMMLGMAGTAQHGTKIILPSLAVSLLLSLLPGGKRIVNSPGMENFPQNNIDWYRSTLTEVFNAAMAGEITPVIAERISLKEATRAHESFEKGTHIGKYILITRFGEML